MSRRVLDRPRQTGFKTKRGLIGLQFWVRHSAQIKGGCWTKVWRPLGRRDLDPSGPTVVSSF